MYFQQPSDGRDEWFDSSYESRFDFINSGWLKIDLVGMPDEGTFRCSSRSFLLIEDVVEVTPITVYSKCLLQKFLHYYELLQPIYKPINLRFHVVVVVVVTPPLPWDGGMARTSIQVHAVNLIELDWGKGGSPFRTSHE